MNRCFAMQPQFFLYLRRQTQKVCGTMIHIHVHILRYDLFEYMSLFVPVVYIVFFRLRPAVDLYLCLFLYLRYGCWAELVTALASRCKLAAEYMSQKSVCLILRFLYF